MDDEVDQIFSTPDELMCPITYSLFQDPVLNLAGHVYERKAILNYWMSRPSNGPLLDPMSQTVLAQATLTPVFVLKSKSEEYRINTTKICIETATTPGCKDPVRYLRRACEVGAPGQPDDVVAYVESHASNAFDVMVIFKFAETLYKQGYKEKAANLHIWLLVHASLDVVEQATQLLLCLKCLQAGDSLWNAESIRSLIAMLAAHQGDNSITWTKILDVALSETQTLGCEFVCDFCHELLYHSTYAENNSIVGGVMIRYVDCLWERNFQLSAGVKDRDDWRRRKTTPSSSRAREKKMIGVRRPRWTSNPVVISCLAVVSFLAKQGPVARICNVAAILLAGLKEPDGVAAPEKKDRCKSLNHSGILK